MSESKRPTRPSAQGQVGASVPILFSLKNVQPKIVGSIANGGADSAKAVAVADLSSAKPAVTSAPADSNTLAKPKVQQNRAYNIAVSLLFLAVCLLVIRNSQGPKSGPTDSLAATGASSAPTTIAKPDLGPKAIASTSTKQAEMAPFELNAPINWSPSSLLSSSNTTLVAAERIEPEQSATLLTVSNSTVDSPRVPPLLANSKTEVVVQSGVASNTGPSGESSETSRPSLSFPETRLAANPAFMDAANSRVSSMEGSIAGSSKSVSEPQTISSAKANGANDAVNFGPVPETNAPALTTRQLIDMHERSRQTPASTLNSEQANYNPPTGLPSVPSTGIAALGISATSVSNTTTMPVNSPNRANTPYRPLESDNQIMNGKPYPPLPKEAAPLIIPPYEQNSSAGRLLGPETQQSLPPIRQPATYQPLPNQLLEGQATSSGNRYQPFGTQPHPQAPAQPVPYTRIPQPQSGNSFGYPPMSAGN